MKAPRARDDVDEERLTMLSVLQELTVAALDLFDPMQPIDDFLERLAERLLVRVALCIEQEGQSVRVIGSAGLSRPSRALPLPERSVGAHDWDSVAFPYPEVRGANVTRWVFALGPETSSETRWTLMLFFDGDPAFALHYRGMVSRLSAYLNTALAHRQMRVREQATSAASEHARNRSEFLAEASSVLSGSLDRRFSAVAAARLVASRFGDWCTVDAFDRDGSIRRLAAVHRSPAVAALAEQLEQVIPDPNADEGVPRVLRSGRTAVYTNIREDDLRADAKRCPPLGTRDALQLELARKIGTGSYLVLPLIARGSTLGALACGAAPPGREYDRDEIALAEELARRISLWLDNAQLVEHLRASLEELGRTQHALVQRERLAALGELAATVAHEVRNPLAAMSNSVASLRRLLRPEGDAATLLRVLEEENSRLNRLVGDMLDFSRPPAPVLFPEPLAAVLEEVFEGSARAAAESPGITVNWHIDATMPPVRIDARLIRTTFSNLFANAMQSMPGGGRIDVTVERVGDVARPWAQITIADTGEGMGAATLQRLFEPFFTTRATGTGLGLAIVKRIIESHHGTISVTSEVGRGTTVIVRLPFDGESG